MAAKTNTELEELGIEALIEELRATKQEALNLRFRNATGSLDNNAEIPHGAQADRPHQHPHPPARDRRGRGRQVT